VHQHSSSGLGNGQVCNDGYDSDGILRSLLYLFLFFCLDVVYLSIYLYHLYLLLKFSVHIITAHLAGCISWIELTAIAAYWLILLAYSLCCISQLTLRYARCTLDSGTSYCRLRVSQARPRWLGTKSSHTHRFSISNLEMRIKRFNYDYKLRYSH
jgi:hypothetical protein